MINKNYNFKIWEIGWKWYIEKYDTDLMNQKIMESNPHNPKVSHILASHKHTQKQKVKEQSKTDY